VAKNNGRFFGFVNGGCLPTALAASWLVSAWDQNAAFFVQSPTAVVLEEVASNGCANCWGCRRNRRRGGDRGHDGQLHCASCGAPCTARPRRLGCGGEGLSARPTITVVVGEEVHASVTKALGLLGLGRKRVVRVPVDGQGRMRADALPPMDGRTILCLQAGNVNTGAFDAGGGNLPHCAGGRGLDSRGWGLRAVGRRFSGIPQVYQGFEQADSWATDAHKWPNIGYDCGIALVREPEQLRAAMSIQASYLSLGEHREPPTTIRSFRGGRAAWNCGLACGRWGVRHGGDRGANIEHARRFAAGLRAAGFRCSTRWSSTRFWYRLARRADAADDCPATGEGTCWCGSTVWQGADGHAHQRLVVGYDKDDVERSIARW